MNKCLYSLECEQQNIWIRTEDASTASRRWSILLLYRRCKNYDMFWSNRTFLNKICSLFFKIVIIFQIFLIFMISLWFSNCILKSVLLIYNMFPSRTVEQRTVRQAFEQFCIYLVKGIRRWVKRMLKIAFISLDCTYAAYI